LNVVTYSCWVVPNFFQELPWSNFHKSLKKPTMLFEFVFPHFKRTS
jgi:hypothetical protein